MVISGETAPTCLHEACPDEATAHTGDLAALAAVAEALPDAVLVIASGSRVCWANRAAERLFGLPVDEAIGQNGLDFIHPDDFQLAALALTSVQGKEVGTPL